MPDSVTSPSPPSTNVLTVLDIHLPALYRRADEASQKGERQYLLLVKSELAFLALVALISSLSFSQEELGDLSLVLGSILLLLGTIATACLSLTPYKDQWWTGRAVAESIKTQAWRYMMKAEPYAKPGSGGSDLKTDQRFTATLRSLVNQRETVALLLPPGKADDAEITRKMREIQKESLAERKRIYVRDRLLQQERWYEEKADSNLKNKRSWYIAVISFQAVAILCSILLLSSEQARSLLNQPRFSFNPLGLLPTLAASSLAWLQVKQHEGLAQSYQVAQRELSLVKNHAPSIHTEEDFSTFVADAENAISREHTLWRARRDSMLNLTDGPTA